MNKIVGYFVNTPTWRIITKREYRKNFTHDVAIHYLQNEIYESIEREVKQTSSGQSSSFYAGLRFLFAELTYLARLYWGKVVNKNESSYVVRYMRKFNILSPGCGVYYEVFRHGLMHTHHPKYFIKGNKLSGWYISNMDKLSSFGILIPEFANQLKVSIVKFIQELEKERREKRKTRLNKFYKELSRSGKILTKNEMRKYARSDFYKIKI